MIKTTPINSNHPLVGKWQSPDDFSDVVVTIAAEINGFFVSVVDESDGEVAEVMDPKYYNEVLTFKVHWPSNGRFVQYRFLLQSKHSISVTYTYSSQEIWGRVYE